LADAFELQANAYERTFLLRDFYGKETLLFDTTQSSAEDKERAKRGLAGLLEGANDGRRKRTLAAVKENLMLVYVPGKTFQEVILSYSFPPGSITQTKAQ
jgi:pumilio family protein 6